MVLKVNYGAVFGKGDGSDIFEFGDYELSPEQEFPAIKALLTEGADGIDGVTELADLLSKIYEDVKEQATSEMIEGGDEYSEECMGYNYADADLIQELIDRRDKKALEYFELNTDEDIENFDPAEHEDEAMVCEIDSEFEESSPFDMGYHLYIDYEDTKVNKEEATKVIKKLLEDGDQETIDRILEGFGNEAYYDEESGDDDLETLVKEIIKNNQ